MFGSIHGRMPWQTWSDLPLTRQGLSISRHTSVVSAESVRSACMTARSAVATVGCGAVDSMTGLVRGSYMPAALHSACHR